MRFGLIFSMLSAVACGETAVKTVNATPEAYITSHATGDTVDDATTETIRGQVADSDHALSELTTAWLYNGDPVCPDSAPDDAGAVSCDVTFTTDGGDVTLTVRDPDGESATARVSLDVQETDAPRAELTSPVAEGVYYSDQSIAFQGTVSDTEDDPEDLTVTFETDALGDLGLDITVTSEGAVEAFGMLDEGEHAVRLAVTDTSGKQSIDSALINVGPPNSAPTCAITAPEDLSAGSEGELIIFSATVTDADIPANMLSVEWASDKDGPIGTSTPDSEGNVSFPYEGLTVNTHVISMTATDELGANCAANVIYSVGTPPVLNVTAPADGVTLNHSDAVVFEATVTDNEDLPNEVSLSWESDIDGVFSTDGADSSGAATVSIATLSAGDHVVTVTATDTDGLFVTDTVSFNLNQPPTVPTVTLEPDPAATNQMLVATASGSVDPEGTGTVTYAYAWFEDGVASAESASATFPASATGKNHTYRVQVTASDGLVDSAFGYAEVNVINSNPVLSGPTLSAATVTVGDVLTCTASATDIDPEDSPTVTYAWSDASTGPTYTVTMTDAVDSTITCTATADDADGGVVTGTASATVTNTAPTVDTVTVSPATGQVGDVLTCTATASDADGTTPDITYAWTDGSTGPTYTITADDAVDATITCTATATDVYDTTGVGTASATVTNTAPVMGTVSISPDPAYNTDTLVCAATATDADGTAPDITYEWTGGATTAELPLTSIIAASGDTLTCTATATDAYDETDIGTATITLGNRDPSVTAVITPEDPRRTDTLTCTATDVTDPDDDATAVAFAWTVGGVDAAATSTGTESTLDEPIAVSEDVVCTITVTDGKDGSGSSTATVTVGNTPPVVADATLVPSEVYTGDTVSAVATATDADGDSLTLTYAFSVDGTVVQDGPDNNLDGTVHFDKGQTLTVTVTASDGIAEGSDPSGSVVVRNTAPTAPTVSVTQNEACSGSRFVGTGWLLMPNGTACAKAYKSSGQWEYGEMDCARQGTLLDGHLVRYFSDEDREFAQDLFEAEIDGRYWIGLMLSEDGTSTSWTGGGSTEYIDSIYSFTDSGERCLEDSTSGSLNDVPCVDLSREGYVCEVPANPTVGLTCTIDEESTDADGDTLTYAFAWDVEGIEYTDAESSTYDGDQVPSDDLEYAELWTCEVTASDDEATSPASTGSHTTDFASIPSACVEGSTGTVEYLMCPTRDKERDEAHDFCQSMGFDGLASIHNETEQLLLESMHPGGTGWYYWIGINDMDTEGEYVWADDTPLGSYTNWKDTGSLEPTDDRCEPYPMCGLEDCGSWAAGDGGYPKGKWGDQRCNIPQSYICEQR